MAIDPKAFIKSISTGVRNAGETLKNYSAAAVGNTKLHGLMGVGGQKDKLANKMMAKYYPSPTVTGTSTWNKRKRETFNKISQGKMSQARNDLQSLKDKFNKDNY